MSVAPRVVEGGKAIDVFAIAEVGEGDNRGGER